MRQNDRRSTLLRVGESAGKEIANLYTRGVNQGYEGHPLEAQYLLDLLDVFGEVGVRMYLVGILEGEEDAEEEEAAADPDAAEVIVDYETGEVTHIERTDADENAPLDDSDSDEDPNPN
jgi:hypothetical protein